MALPELRRRDTRGLATHHALLALRKVRTGDGVSCAAGRVAALLLLGGYRQQRRALRRSSIRQPGREPTRPSQHPLPLFPGGGGTATPLKALTPFLLRSCCAVSAAPGRLRAQRIREEDSTAARTSMTIFNHAPQPTVRWPLHASSDYHRAAVWLVRRRRWRQRARQGRPVPTLPIAAALLLLCCTRPSVSRGSKARHFRQCAETRVQSNCAFVCLPPARAPARLAVRQQGQLRRLSRGGGGGELGAPRLRVAHAARSAEDSPPPPPGCGR